MAIEKENVFAERQTPLQKSITGIITSIGVRNQMPSDDTIQRLFEKLDTLKDVVNEVKIDVATIKSNQSKHYELNDKEHQNMVAIIADTKTEVDDIKEDISGLKEGHDEQQSVLDVRQGMHKIVWWILGGVGAFIAGGAGWILSKVSGG